MAKQNKNDKNSGKDGKDVQKGKKNKLWKKSVEIQKKFVGKQMSKFLNLPIFLFFNIKTSCCGCAVGLIWWA